MDQLENKYGPGTKVYLCFASSVWSLAMKVIPFGQDKQRKG